MHVDRLAFSSLLLRDELARGHVVSCDVPFRSVSNSSLHDLCGEVPVEPPSLPWPTPLHGPSPTPVSLDFLDQPRPEGKRNVRRNRDPEFAYLFMSRAELTSPDYSGARHDKIRREQSRRVKVPPLRLDLNAYYGIGDQIIVVTVQAGAMFVHGRTGSQMCGACRRC